jgi:hypothetical protein
MFNILSHKGNANQKNTEISSYSTQNGYHQEDDKGEEPLFTVNGNVN